MDTEYFKFIKKIKSLCEEQDTFYESESKNPLLVAIVEQAKIFSRNNFEVNATHSKGKTGRQYRAFFNVIKETVGIAPYDKANIPNNEDVASTYFGDIFGNIKRDMEGLQDLAYAIYYFFAYHCDNEKYLNEINNQSINSLFCSNPDELKLNINAIKSEIEKLKKASSNQYTKTPLHADSYYKKNNTQSISKTSNEHSFTNKPSTCFEELDIRNSQANINCNIHSAFGRIGQEMYLDPSAHNDLGLKKTSFFDFFEDKSFATDTAIYDAREKKKISQYRKNGLNIIVNSLRDNQSYQFNEGAYLSLNNIKDMNLISIGGPRSSFTTRLSFGFRPNENNMSEHNLYYSYDISNTQNVIQENFGEGVLYVPKNIISSKNDVYQTSTQNIHDDKEILNTDLALLTLVANPFNHRKWHVIISACHGVGCAALSALLNNTQFQKESKYIDFMDGACPSKNYYQALIRLNVYWQNQATRYEVNTSSGRYYEIIDVQNNLEALCLISEEDAVSMYKKMLSSLKTHVMG